MLIFLCCCNESSLFNIRLFIPSSSSEARLSMAGLRSKLAEAQSTSAQQQRELLSSNARILHLEKQEQVFIQFLICIERLMVVLLIKVLYTYAFFSR